MTPKSPMTTKKLDAARANLDAALREESQALTSACDAVNACGATSDEAVQGLRSAQAAHARSNAAASELRGLALDVARADALAQVPAVPLPPADAGPRPDCYARYWQSYAVGYRLRDRA